MKKLIIGFTLLSSFTYAQKSTADLVPSNAFIAFKINAPEILKSISAEEIQSYDFMQEVFKNKEAKNLNEIGIDLSQSIYFFSIADSASNCFGVCMKTNDVKRLKHYLDIEENQKTQKIESWKVSETGNDVFAVKKSWVILADIDVSWSYRNKVALEIVGEYPTYPDNYYQLDSTEKAAIRMQHDNYYDRKNKVLDSLGLALSKPLLQNLFASINNGKTLSRTSKRFKTIVAAKNSASFYYNANHFFDGFASDIEEELGQSGHDFIQSSMQDYSLVISGVANKQTIDVTMETNYNNKLGNMIVDLFNQPVDEELINAIPKKNYGLMVANYNFKAIYDYLANQPIHFSDSNVQDSREMELALATWSIVSEFIDTDKLFETFKGNVFFSYNGLEKVHYTTIESEWDEENFAYHEKTVNKEDLMPKIAIGFASEHPEILEKIIRLIRSSAGDTSFVGENGVYTLKKGFFNSMDMFVLNKKGVLIITNDAEYKENFLKGNNHLPQEMIDKITSAKYFYANFDGQKIVKQIEFLSDLDSNALSTIHDLGQIMGQADLNVRQINNKQMLVDYKYGFNEDKNGFHHILHLINLLYLSDQREDDKMSHEQKASTIITAPVKKASPDDEEDKD